MGKSSTPEENHAVCALRIAACPGVVKDPRADDLHRRLGMRTARLNCEVAMKWIITVALLTVATTASAQTIPENAWSRGTTLEGFVGTATTPSTMDAYGGAVGWELTHRFEIQGLGAWLPRRGTDEFAADLKLLMNLSRPSIVVPYVAGGAGLYQGSFDRARAETDPTAVVGAGAHVYLRRHLSIRPEATLRLVLDRSDVYKVATITVALAYHFEGRAVANAR
jgi:hypothetical protein